MTNFVNIATTDDVLIIPDVDKLTCILSRADGSVDSFYDEGGELGGPFHKRWNKRWGLKADDVLAKLNAAGAGLVSLNSQSPGHAETSVALINPKAVTFVSVTADADDTGRVSGFVGVEGIGDLGYNTTMDDIAALLQALGNAEKNMVAFDSSEVFASIIESDASDNLTETCAALLYVDPKALTLIYDDGLEIDLRLRNTGRLKLRTPQPDEQVVKTKLDPACPAAELNDAFRQATKDLRKTDHDMLVVKLAQKNGNLRILPGAEGTTYYSPAEVLYTICFNAGDQPTLSLYHKKTRFNPDGESCDLRFADQTRMQAALEDFYGKSKPSRTSLAPPSPDIH
ncbi:MAG: hypothetical protein ACXW4B_08690 [Micavibrio sp.]